MSAKHIQSTEGCAVCQEDQVRNVGLKQERTREGTAKICCSFFMLEKAILAKLKPNKTDALDQPPKRRSMLQE